MDISFGSIGVHDHIDTIRHVCRTGSTGCRHGRRRESLGGLEARWRSTDTYRAKFKQRIEISGVGGDVESGGKFYFSRPDRMLWDYSEGQEQKVVGDGSYVWIYQPDLEQAYRVGYSKAFGSGGLVALLAGREGLGQRFDVVLLENGSEQVRIRLEPRSEIGETLDLTLRAGTMDLVAVRVTDPAGSVTFVEFEGAERNVPIDQNLFEFTPPDGIDIITTTAQGQ